MTGSPTERFRRVDAIFDAALDLPVEEQAAFIDRESGGDESLRAEVLGLMRAYHHSDSVLDSPAARLAAPLLDGAAAIGGPVPGRIGPFRVVRELGRGGMGRVLLGERDDGQFEQRVAIKVIHQGGPGVLRRFVEERRILALLEHPGIARLVDGGITEQGLPYFAMELVEGEPIDRYCETHDLTLDQRLELFTGVCDAVAYAHQHLVVHRDLKPSNILVTARRPGEAARLRHRQADRRAGGGGPHADGVPGHDPGVRRARADPRDPISSATDVYALGVLLYQILTGSRPYDLKGRSPAEVERVVCVEAPPRPSSRAPVPLARRLRGDLDLIVLTALQKEQDRRYRSPADLAEDLRRFRAGTPRSSRGRTARGTGWASS